MEWHSRLSVGGNLAGVGVDEDVLALGGEGSVEVVLAVAVVSLFAMVHSSCIIASPLCVGYCGPLPGELLVRHIECFAVEVLGLDRIQDVDGEGEETRVSDAGQ